jgi:hypothetical protein
MRRYCGNYGFQSQAVFFFRFGHNEKQAIMINEFQEWLKEQPWHHDDSPVVDLIPVFSYLTICLSRLF